MASPSKENSETHVQLRNFEITSGSKPRWKDKKQLENGREDAKNEKMKKNISKKKRDRINPSGAELNSSRVLG